MTNLLLKPLLILAGIIISGGILWYFVYSIYEIKIVVENEKIEVNSCDYAIINIVPVNFLGRKIPHRRVSFEYKIIENSELILIAYDEVDNSLKATQNGKIGKAKIMISTKYSLFPALVLISVVEQKK